MARLSLAATLVACGLVIADVSGVFARLLRSGNATPLIEQSTFVAIFGMLIYGNLVYQLTRLGELTRSRDHVRATVGELARFRSRAPAITILVPSYREEIAAVRQTLLSAALQDYPAIRVVLLIDDPPRPEDAAARAALESARRLPGVVLGLLEKPARHFARALADFEDRVQREPLDPIEEMRLLASLHAEAAKWFDAQAAQEPTATHTDRWFIEVVFGRPGRAHFDAALALEARLAAGKLADREELRRGHEELAARFTVRLESFERKRFVNLSHMPNKAMNLNSFIGLIGGHWREQRCGDVLHLVAASGVDATLAVPDADLLITLDADSLLDSGYALRLAHFLMRPGNERLAVVQTPYSAIPGATSELERLAGATTDIQYITHQGFTRYGATYWVGANAMLRREALEDIRTVELERGYQVLRYIQDRTVIEDTESSIDLVARGWSLHNYPERLAWSATPADFGSLLIQRRRWANGGLLIAPKLLRHVWNGAWRPVRGFGEGLIRLHYLISIAAVNLGLLALFVYPFESPVRGLYIGATALPYFLSYGLDLSRSGYRFADVWRVYALNLLLLPVNLGGVFQSVQQAITGRKTPFARTPKVDERTATPALYLLALYGLLGLIVLSFAIAAARQRWLHAAFFVLNGGLLGYAVLRCVGIRETLEDLRAQISARR